MATKITTPELFNLSSNNTAATQLPVFTTSTRPTPATSTVQVEYLVVAGGGGGGNYDGGGGGAGGYLTNYNGTPISITTSNLYTVAVGEGGVGGIKNAITSGVGGNSIFDTIISYGGGGGASDNNTGPSSDGGSGGGAAGGSNPTIGLASPPGQGYNGGNSSGNSGGGGGGASEAGNTDGQGHGGDGLSNSITGTATFYAGGGGGDFRTGGYPGGDGGGGAGSGSLPSNNGTPNTGGGGGAIGGSTSYQGGSGGSGIVILRYPTSSSLNITTTGSLVYTESTDGSDTVLQFTEGSGNFGFAANNITVGEMIFNSTTGKVEYWDGFQWNMIKDEEQIDPTKDLVLYLDANDPTSGISNTSWVDISGNNYSLTANGTIVLGGTSPQKKYDIAFGDYFGLPNTAPPFGNTNGVISIECWVKLNTNTSRAYWFSTSSTTNNNDYFYIGWLADLGNIYIAYRNGTTSDQYFELGALSGNTSWQHIFCQLNGSTKEIWINGIQQSTTSSGSGSSSGWVNYVSYATATSTNIGILRKSSISYGDANYGQIRYWSAPKTQAEIIFFYNQRATDFGKTPIT